MYGPLKVCTLAHCEPYPGSQSDFESHEEVQFPAPQKVGPMPQIPLFEQHPILQGFEGLQVKSSDDGLPFVWQNPTESKAAREVASSHLGNMINLH